MVNKLIEVPLRSRDCRHVAIAASEVGRIEDTVVLSRFSSSYPSDGSMSDAYSSWRLHHSYGFDWG